MFDAASKIAAKLVAEESAVRFLAELWESAMGSEGGVGLMSTRKHSPDSIKPDMGITCITDSDKL